MGTWDEGTQEIVCEHCGAVHIAGYKDFPQKDKGSQECLKCGKELISWHGTRDYLSFKLK